MVVSAVLVLLLAGVGLSGMMALLMDALGSALLDLHDQGQPSPEPADAPGIASYLNVNNA